MRAALVVLVAGIALATSCLESLSPEDVAGTYRLRTIDAAGPPWITVSDTTATQNGEPAVFEVTSELVSAWLELTLKKTFSRTWEYHNTMVVTLVSTGDTVTVTDTTYSRTRVGTFHLHWDTIRFYYQLEDEYWTGTLADAEITVVTRRGTEYVYRREG